MSRKTNKQLEILIDESGTCQFIHDDELAGLYQEGNPDIKRASNVEPETDPKMAGMWCVDLTPVGGGTTHGFQEREKALEFEREFIQQRMFGGGFHSDYSYSLLEVQDA